MDRNTLRVVVKLYRGQVALRKESVDRNLALKKVKPGQGVALRKESVDRNIADALTAADQALVALRKESVDRNLSVLP